MSSRHDVALALRETVGSIYITAHVSPDGDAIGSLLALTGALRQLGKEVIPVLEDEIPENLTFLPGSEEIRQGSKLEKPKSGMIISVDVSGRGRMSIPADWNLPLIVIDHHLTGDKVEGLIWSEPTATATGELIFDLITEEFKTEITKEIANCLYLAIASDCGFFRYSNTTAKVLRKAAELVEQGASPNFISEHFEIRSMKTLERLTESLATLDVIWDGWLAEMTVFSRSDDPAGFSEGFVDFPRSVPTAQVACLYKVVDDQTVRVSLRSRGANVASVAQNLGGGGHFRAAGLTFRGSLEEAKEAVQKELSKIQGDA